MVFFRTSPGKGVLRQRHSIDSMTIDLGGIVPSQIVNVHDIAERIRLVDTAIHNHGR